MRAQRQVRAHAKQACYTKAHPLPIPLSLFPCLYRPIPIALSLSAYLHPRQRVKIRDTALHHVPIRDTARVRSSHRLHRLPPVQQARRATTCAVSRHVEQLRLVLVHPGGARASQRRARTRCTLPLPPFRWGDPNAEQPRGPMADRRYTGQSANSPRAQILIDMASARTLKIDTF